MFSESRNGRHRRIGDHAVADCDNAAGIIDNATGTGDNSSEIGNDTTGIIDIAMNLIPC